MKLDFTDSVSENGNHIDVVAADYGESMMDKEEIFSGESEDEEDEKVEIQLRRRGGFHQCSKGKFN